MTLLLVLSGVVSERSLAVAVRPIGLVILAPSASAVLSTAEALAVGVCVLAILVEGVGDEQLRRFREIEANKGGCCESGLWRWCRHPNYFGEVLFHAGALWCDFLLIFQCV